MNTGHKTVLLDEAVENLNLKANGQYVDATFGRGGHSKKILKHLEQGKLLVIDRDPQAIKAAEALALEDSRVLIQKASFERVKEIIEERFDGKVDGILFDFGVSSPQLDVADRGFSFNQNGPLDMRMDNTKGETAAQWINKASWKEMSKVFWRYGEEKHATKIAKEIELYREQVGAFETTKQLADLVAKTIRTKNKHPATRVFQATRIHINRELEQISNVLPDALDCLASQGRLVVISFHSLEDRIVKKYFKSKLKPVKFDKRMPINIDAPAEIKLIGKATKPSSREIEENPRSRSAIMRVVEKV